MEERGQPDSTHPTVCKSLHRGGKAASQAPDLTEKIVHSAAEDWQLISLMNYYVGHHYYS